MIRLRSREQLGICESIDNPDKLLGKRIDFCIKRSCKIALIFISFTDIVTRVDKMLITDYFIVL